MVCVLGHPLTSRGWTRTAIVARRDSQDSTTDAGDLVRYLAHASSIVGSTPKWTSTLVARAVRKPSARAISVTVPPQPDRFELRPGSCSCSPGDHAGDVPVGDCIQRVPASWPMSSEMIINFYIGGMTVRDIPYHLATAMGMGISPGTVSALTDAVLEGVMS